ncbi:MAG: hypothetical protein QOD33_205 [Pyrinomonadaceae bacterium]|jgi:hypothetical protein|nr:hypothetical protein [Pyrinomonadaceae bacterium]
MRDEHIIGLLENAPLTSFAEPELSAIRIHSENCPACLRALQAARISARLLQERAALELSPSPFFHTRVLAALRERQAANDNWAWSRMWRAAGALASSMVVTVAALAVFTFVAPSNQVTAPAPGWLASYSAEEIILDQSTAESQGAGASDGQVLNAIYSDEEAVK